MPKLSCVCWTNLSRCEVARIVFRNDGKTYVYSAWIDSYITHLFQATSHGCLDSWLLEWTTSYHGWDGSFYIKNPLNVNCKFLRRHAGTGCHHHLFVMSGAVRLKDEAYRKNDWDWAMIKFKTHKGMTGNIMIIISAISICTDGDGTG